MMPGFDPMLLLVLNLAGTFAFGLSGGMAGVRARLDLFGVVVLAVVVGLAGGITRDLLIREGLYAFPHCLAPRSSSEQLAPAPTVLQPRSSAPQSVL